jgi:hypothetical protein
MELLTCAANSNFVDDPSLWQTSSEREILSVGAHSCNGDPRTPIPRQRPENPSAFECASTLVDKTTRLPDGYVLISASNHHGSDIVRAQSSSFSTISDNLSLMRQIELVGNPFYID